MADIYFYNDIRYFRDLKPYISIVIARDAGAEIYGYSNVNLVIKVGE